MDSAPQKLIKLLLDKSFYDDNKHRVVKEMFPGSLGAIYESIKEGHERYGRSLSVDEIGALHKILNPAATRAERTNIQELLLDVESAEPMGKDIAKDVLSHMWRIEVYRRLAEQAVDGMNGKVTTLNGIQRILETHGEDFLPVEDIQKLGYEELEDLLEVLNDRTCWRFNIPSLAKWVPGGAAGDFMIAFARPEVGKTAFHVSLSCAPNGFVSQGAKVLSLLNEEPGVRTLMRGASACTGMTRDQLSENVPMYGPVVRELRRNYDVIDNVDMTMERLDAYCKRHKPDILITDQLDKVHVSGSFAREDQKLRQIYTQGREIAKRHGLFHIGICQASADAEGKTKLHYSMMEGSKTGKAAEADLIIGIGKRGSDEGPAATNDDDPLRYLTVSKNKITGWHGTVIAKLEGSISVYHD